MGKGEIKSGGEDGNYQVEIQYNRDRYDAQITALDKKKDELVEARVPIEEQRSVLAPQVDMIIHNLGLMLEELVDLLDDLFADQAILKAYRADLEILEEELRYMLEHEPPYAPEAIEAKQNEIADKKEQISDKQEEITAANRLIEEKRKEITAAQKIATSLDYELALLVQKIAEIDLQILAIEKRKQYLEENMPEDETTQVWCADLTEDLEGLVGTIEIPGELGEKGITQIQPGYIESGTSPAVYDQVRDGQLFPNVAATPSQAFYNACMLPGWQKWQTNFRHGVINSISEEGKANITLLSEVTSSAQDLNIDPISSLSSVDIEYMYCDEVAFDDGDEVLIKFEPKQSVKDKLNEIADSKSELMDLLKELGLLRGEESNLYLEELSNLIKAKGYLLDQLGVLMDELEILQEAEPTDPVAIAAKIAEIEAKDLEIEDKQEEIDNKEIEITDKQEEIEAKQKEINEKKKAIKALVDGVVGSMSDFVEPVVIGFKEEPQPCATYTGIMGSTNQFMDSVDDDKIYEWRQGDAVEGTPGQTKTIYTDLPDSVRDYNNSWSLGSKVQIGGRWKYPFVSENEKDIRMKIVVNIKIHNESGMLIHSIPLRVYYEDSYNYKDKVIAGGTGYTEFCNRTAHRPHDEQPPVWTTSAQYGCGVDFEFYGVDIYKSTWATWYWDIWGMNGQPDGYYPFYRLSWQEHFLYEVFARYAEEYGPMAAGDYMGYSLGGLADGSEPDFSCGGLPNQRTPGCYGWPGVKKTGIDCSRKEDVGYDEFWHPDPNNPHPCFVEKGGDLEALYIEQEWSMEGIITEDGVTLTDNTGVPVTIQIKGSENDLVIPLGGYNGTNATQGDVQWSDIAGKTENHHVRFSVSAYVTDNNTHSAMIKRHLPNPTHWYREFDPFYEEYTDEGYMEFYATISPHSEEEA